MTMRAQIETLLAQSFSPEHLEVIDESEKHHGHAGWREGGETHFRVRIVADAFAGKNRLARHRAVNACLKGPLDAGVHALAIEARAPGEADPRDAARRVNGPT
ncbi:BolA family transcriptional regulator [Stappia taiwanensis]|uniref:BolA family transcriptional regulator n=1 Tax=Stappia taiwanensis TaxID=992267 RepID=A0A838XSM8_9HYPH|nr:BolA family protein [Stappia taiwanensis]MBA4611546.1 BolA family transcriptional regulator [Stappia taiwanensis]